MESYCAFSKNHECILWMDYEITRWELTEANELCHNNWLEIERQRTYIEALQKLLTENNISYPDEYLYE